MTPPMAFFVLSATSLCISVSSKGSTCIYLPTTWNLRSLSHVIPPQARTGSVLSLWSPATRALREALGYNLVASILKGL